MLRFQVNNEHQQLQLEHPAGPIEFGRGPKCKDVPRCTIQDEYVSRDHIRLEELPGGRLRVQNLSQRSPISVADGSTVPTGATCDLELPVRLGVGTTVITVLRTVPETMGEAPQTIV